MLVLSLANIRYLTGFTGSSALLLIREAGATLITDFRYVTAIATAKGTPSECPGLDLATGLDRQRGERNEKRCATGFRAHIATVRDGERIATIEHAKWEPVSDLVEQLRLVKDPGEVQAIRRAAEVAQAALNEVLGRLQQDSRKLRWRRCSSPPCGEGERVASVPDYRRVGAAGRAASCPNQREGDQAGEFLLLDFGAQVDGYCADLTRTVVVGARADQRQRLVYNTVATAQRQALNGIRAGLTGREADSLAREVIVSAASERPSGIRWDTAWGWRCTRRPGWGRQGRPLYRRARW